MSPDFYFHDRQIPARTSGRVSWIAAVLLSSWLIALLVAISEAPKWGWASSSVLGLLVAAANSLCSVEVVRMLSRSIP